METNEALFQAEDLVFAAYTRPWSILYQHLKFWVLLLALFQAILWMGTVLVVGLRPILFDLITRHCLHPTTEVFLVLDAIYAVLSMMAATVFDAAVVYRTAAHYAGDRPDWKACARPGMRKVALLLLPCFFLHTHRFLNPTRDMLDVVMRVYGVKREARNATSPVPVPSSTDATPSPDTIAEELLPMGVIVDSPALWEDTEPLTAVNNATDTNGTVAVFPAAVNLPTSSGRTLKRGRPGVNAGPRQAATDDSSQAAATESDMPPDPNMRSGPQQGATVPPTTPAGRRLFRFVSIIAELEWLFVHIGIFVIPIVLVERKGLVAAARRSFSLSLSQWDVVVSAHIALWLLKQYCVPFLIKKVGIPFFVVSKLTWPLELILVTVTYFAARVCDEGLTCSDFMEEWYTHVLHEEGGTTDDVIIGAASNDDDAHILHTKEEASEEGATPTTTDTETETLKNTQTKEETEKVMKDYYPMEEAEDPSVRSDPEEDTSETVVLALDEPTLDENQEETSHLLSTSTPRRKGRDKRQKTHEIQGMPPARAETLDSETKATSATET